MSKISVLLVDDDKMILESILHQIDWSALGFKIVATAANGSIALALYREKKPDLVITDVVMPVVGGLELIREIRREELNAHILLMSSHEEFAYVKEAIALGVSGYVLKSELFGEEFLAKLRACQADISKDMNRREATRRAMLESCFAPGRAISQPLYPRMTRRTRCWRR